MAEKENIDKRIKKAELKKIETETSKFAEEKVKTEIERKELEKNFNKPWYRKDKFYQALAAGVFAFPILWFFFDSIVKPLYNVENYKLEEVNEKTKKMLRIEKGRLDSIQIQLDSMQIQVASMQNEFKKELYKLETENDLYLSQLRALEDSAKTKSEKKSLNKRILMVEAQQQKLTDKFYTVNNPIELEIALKENTKAANTFFRAKDLYTKDEYTRAIPLFEEAAGEGISEAMVYLGKMYVYGSGVDEDLTKAFSWFRKAADKANPSAMYWLGVLSESGEIAQSNPDSAKIWYKRAAELDHEDAKRRYSAFK